MKSFKVGEYETKIAKAIFTILKNDFVMLGNRTYNPKSRIESKIAKILKKKAICDRALTCNHMIRVWVL